MNNNNKTEIATLANGCFWCTEAIFKKIKGVKYILPGYTGGTLKNPSYDQVLTMVNNGATLNEIIKSDITSKYDNLYSDSFINSGDFLGFVYNEVIIYK